MKAFDFAYWLQFVAGVEFEDKTRWEEVSNQATQLAAIVGAAVDQQAVGPVLAKGPSLNEIGVELSTLPAPISADVQDCIHAA